MSCRGWIVGGESKGMKVRNLTELAEAEGVQRPYGILRRMGAEIREDLASVLGWCFPREGRDADLESWEIIHKARKGLQARTHYVTEAVTPFTGRNSWWVILTRTARWLRIRFYPGISDVDVEHLIFERAVDLAIGDLDPSEIPFLDRLAEEASGFHLTARSLGLSRNAVRLIMAGLMGAGMRAGISQVPQWINDGLRSQTLLPSVTRGLRYLRESLHDIVESWKEMGVPGRRPDPNLRRVAFTVSTIHFLDLIDQGIDEYETARA